MTRIHYVGWAGRDETIECDTRLGWGSDRGYPLYGIRRALWDAAYGFVNGFKVSAILYFVLTRSFSSRVRRWAMEREGVKFSDDGIPSAIIGSVER